MFKDSFKYYKSRNPRPSFGDVLDVDRENLRKISRIPLKTDLSSKALEFGLRDVSSWEAYEFLDSPGLMFIRNPFTATGQRFWITKCLRDYSKKPNKLNIDAHDLLNPEESWWDVCTGANERAKQLTPKLRWSTLGYHHDWDTKNYSEDSRGEIPEELGKMTRALAEALNFRDFTAEAAIINYYRMNSTLAGHVDHSEVNMKAPLFSISFGQTAIFLIGGHKQQDPAQAIFLRSGDVIVMSNESRLKYHGVPRILPSESTPWESQDEDVDDSDDWERALMFILESRINMNVRQVLNPGQRSLEPS